MKRVRILLCLSAGALALAACLAVVVRAEEDDQRVDRATDKALEWLERTQLPDGSWPAGEYRKNAAVTSLALMAFMAKGHVPGEGRYGKVIEKGIDYVLSLADAKTGYIVETRTGSNGGMYCHGTSTLMLAEAVGMTTGEREKKIREVLERAVKLILKAQALQRQNARQQGGWRYGPDSRDSDLSVTGWQLMSLRAAKNAGADVPVEAINDGVAFVKRCASGGGGFGYQPGGGPNLARTGTGILSLEICGQHNTPEAIAAADWLMKNPPRWPDEFFYYGVYYCAQGMFQMGDKYWEYYRPRLEALLLGLQREDSSWPAPQGSEARAGQTYSTAMAVLALSVKYHYLPIYQR